MRLLFATTTAFAMISSAAFAAGGTGWSYKGNTAPENWGDLKEDYATCKTGKLQSPFDIKTTFKTDLPAIQLDYEAAPLSLNYNAHGITVNLPEGQSMTIAGEKYNLLQYHLHAPSEYHMDGKSYPMSLHLVHKRASDGALGVLGVMLEEGDEHAAIAEIWANIPEAHGTATPKDVSVNPADLLPDSHDYVRFMGSLTTPPCSENVHWHVLKQPISVSGAQISAFKTLVGENARPLQPANNRLVIGE